MKTDKLEQKGIDDKFNKFLEDNNLEVSYLIDFPVYKVIPDEVKLALNVLRNHKMRIKFILKDK